jgi:uracil-DNA glycosylase
MSILLKKADAAGGERGHALVSCNATAPLRVRDARFSVHCSLFTLLLLPITVSRLARSSLAASGMTAEPMTAAPFLPERRNLKALALAARSCRGCPLWRDATQTVFGEGLRRSRLMMVGEQPGNEEDLQGRPFVGPAGRELDRALTEAGIPRDDVFVTNVVKHFKWEPRGKRRIHKRPGAVEIQACMPWLEAEIAVVKPEIIVCLGATAAQSLLGGSFRLTRNRGRQFPHDTGAVVTATVHPSSILRAPDDATRRRERVRFTEDLARVREWLG